MSLLYGYDDENNGNIKTYTTSVVFTKYNKRKFIKVFNTGIVLLGIITASAKTDTGIVYYDFRSPDGSVQLAEIQNLNKYSAHNVYTVPKACSITKLSARSGSNTEPPSPVKLKTIQYIKRNK